MHYPEGLSLHTIWEEIAHFIDSTKDLLSLALTCHTFKELIIPDHLHYRNLSINICITKVWEFLARRPRLARSVRFIKLSNITDTERLPPPLSNLAVTFYYDDHVPVTDTDITFFKRAVSHMPLLKEFSWGNLDSVSPEQLIDISHTLTTSAPYLEGLDVDIFNLTRTIRDEKQIKSLSIWFLTSLKRVVLRTIRAQFTSLEAIQMILSCPNIEDLYFQATSHSDTFPFYMMQQANWKKLRRLGFQSLSVSNEEERDTDISAIVTSFFVQHSNIEYLSFDVSPHITLSGTLPPSSLPKLHSLSSNLDVMTSLLPTSVISRLVHLVCVVGQIDPNTLPQMDRLESVQLSGKRNGPDSIHPFLSKAPNLKKIFLSIGELWISPVRLRNQDIQEQYTEPFLKYPQSKLTHIYIDTPLISTGIYRDSLNRQIGAFCQKLSVLRDLKYTGFSLEYVELERDENGTYSGCRFISYKEAVNIFSREKIFSDLSH